MRELIQYRFPAREEKLLDTKPKTEGTQGKLAYFIYLGFSPHGIFFLTKNLAKTMIPSFFYRAARSALLSELEGLDKIVSGLAPIADSAEIRCRVAGGEDHSPKDKWRSEAEEALHKIDFEGIWQGVMKNAKS